MRRLLVVLLVVLLARVDSKSSGGPKPRGLGKKGGKKRSGANKRGVVIQASSVETTKSPEVEEKVSADEKIDILRMKARKCLARQDYNRAANCYAGILQLNEGKGGFEAGELRRRCCLTLAECEIKVGKLEHAISLCTEVIDEMAVRLDEMNQSSTGGDSSENSGKEAEQKLSEVELKEYLGKAYYRRGVSLARLDHHDIAMLDLQEAHLHLPDDELILDRIVAVQGRIDDRNLVEEVEEEEEEEGSSLSSSLSSSSPSPSLSLGELKEQLLDIIEQAQLAEARYLSEEALKVLATEERAVGPPLSPMGGLGALGGASGAGGLGDMLGAMGGMGGGAGAGGLGALMGGLGGGKGGGKLPSLDYVAAMLPMLGGMAGLSPDAIASGKEVLFAISHVGKFFYAVYEKVAPFKDFVFAVVAGVFIFLSTRGGGRG